MKGKIKKLRGILVLLLLMLLSANSKYIMSMAVESEISVNTENITPTANVVLEKYINYEKDGKKGLLVQYQVSAGTEYKNNETFVPLAATGILINAPKIENSFPESVEVISRSTLLTNGSSDGKDYKTTYKQENGELQIAAFNKKDENGNYYETYKKDAKDSYTVILNYGENAYNSENLEKELELNGKVVEVLKVKDSPKVEERYENKTTVKENISKLISTKVDSTKIYNGYIKSNAVNGTDYETNYKENVEINVSKKDLGTSKIDLTQKFINNNNEAVETENIIFKSSTLDKQKVLDILGENGYLKILDKDGNTLGELNKDTEVKEDGKYVVNYPENITKVTLEISNAEKAGYITIQNQKQIKPEEKNTELKQIQEVYNTDEVTSLEIKESQTRVSIVPNLKTWTNEKQNNVEFEVDLYNNSASCNLFKNPVIEIQLPEETRKVILDDATIMHANGITVKSSKYDEKTRIIRVELEGTQNKYLSEKIEKGTILTIPATIMLEKDIEDKDIDLKVGFKNDNIYTGKTETGTSTTKISLENFNQATVSDEIVPTLTKNLRTLSGAKNAEPEENTSVPTASGITLNVTPVIGDVTRDTVYEGEYIKYEITATNTTGKDIDNVKINAVLPEGVIYTNLKTEEVKTRLVNSYEYDENKKNVEIQLGKIKANKSASTFIEVKVKDLEENTNSKEIATKISSYIGDAKTDEKEIKHTVKKAEYKVFLMSNEYAYNQIQHELTVMGNPDKEVTVTFKIPDYSEMEYINFGYQYSFDENGNKYINQEDNKVRSKTIIDENTFSYTVKPGCYLLYSPINTSKIDRKPNESVAELKLYATVNDKYKSNESRVKLPYESLKISISSDKEGEKVNYDEEINYEIKVTNIGRGNYKENGIYYSLVWIKDILPEEVKPIGIIYNKFDTKLDEETKEEIGFEEEKNILENISTRKKDLNGNRLPDIDLPLLIPWKETVTIQVKVKAGFVYKETEIQNRASVTGFSYALQEKDGQTRPHDTVILPMQSDILTNTILPPESIRSNLRAISQNPQTQAEQNSDNGTNNGNNATNQTEENENEEQKYSVKGYAWNDKNADGIKQSSEEIISGIPTYLMDSKGNVVKEAATNEKGIYSFSDVKKGEYTVVFKYDTNKYTITKCKVNGASENANSNATKQNVVIYGENIVAGVTDEINVNKDVLYINLGLIENKKFDFKVDNYISKITVKTKNGTKETPYNNTTLAKSEIKAKEIEGSNVTIEYKVIITNNGEVAGKVGKVIDYLPEGLNVASESLTTWFKNTDGGYINTTLENTLIEPGKSVELTLVTTRDLTENSTGTLTNKVKIDGITNELNLEETNMQNNIAKSEVILSISTGLLIVISIAIIIAVIVLMILNTKFKIFKKLPIRFLAILFVLSTTILMQGQNDSRAVRTEYPVGRIESEQKQLYLVGSDRRWRIDRGGPKSIFVYDGNGGYVPCNIELGPYYLINYNGKLYETHSLEYNYYDEDELKANASVVAENFRGSFGEVAGKVTLPDFKYEYIQINNPRSINCYYLEGDWIDFMELQDGEKIIDNGNGTYSLGPYRHDFGKCISPFMPGGNQYINIENLKFNANGEIIHGDKYINANAMYPITYYRVYNPNPAISYVVEREGAQRQEYSYNKEISYNPDVDIEPESAWIGDIPKEYLEDPNVKFGRYEDPGIVLEGNTDDNIKIRNKNDEYLLGPFNISRYSVRNYEEKYSRYDEGTELFQGYEIEILGNETEPGSGEYWYYNFNPYGKGNKNSNGKFETDYHICDYNGNSVDLDATGTFYIKLSKSEMEGLEFVTQVRARTEVFFTKDVREDRVGTDVWYAGDEYQRVRENFPDDSATVIPIHIESEGEQYIYWTHFPCSIQIHKTDELGVDENGNPIKMEGVNFVINRAGRGWAYYDKEGYIQYGQLDNLDYANGERPVIFTTDANGDSQIIQGFESVGWAYDEYGNIMYSSDANPLAVGDQEIIENGKRIIRGDCNYLIFEIIKDTYSDDSKDYSIPEKYNDAFFYEDYYKSNVDRYIWGCPYDLRSVGLNHSKVGVHESGDDYIKDFDWTIGYGLRDYNDPALCRGIESTFYSQNIENKRDYTSVQITKRIEFTQNKFADEYADLSGFKFKIAKYIPASKSSDGIAKYQWVKKVNDDPEHNQEHSNITFVDNINDTDTVLTTDRDGKTDILRRLPIEDGTVQYYALEVGIPERFKEEYATYKNNGNFFFSNYSDGQYVNLKLDAMTEAKFTVGHSGYYRSFTESYLYKSNQGVIKMVDTNYYDYESIQIEKKNEKGELLDGIGFAIMDITDPNDPFWVKVDNNNFISYKEEDKIRETDLTKLNNSCKFVTGEKGEQGYTRIIKGVGLDRKYQIYEIDIGRYREVYKLKEFTFRGQVCQGNLIKELNKDENGNWITRNKRLPMNDKVHQFLSNNKVIKKDENGKDIYNVVVVKETNKQFYGSFQLHKQDMLTDAPLKGVGIQIKRKGTAKNTGYIKAKSAGYYTVNGKSVPRYEVEDINASYDEATEFFTDEDGNTPIIYMVPLYEENRKTEIKYEAYETMIPTELKDYFALKADFLQDSINNRQSYGPFYNENALNSALRLLNTDIPGLLKILDDISVSGYDKIHINGNDHDEENSINLWLKTYLNIDYSNEDVALNLGEVKITKDTEPKDNTKTLITNAQKENKQTFIKLSGNVWEDSVNEGVKTETGTNGLRNVGPGEDKDKNIQNIEVKLMKRMDCTKLKNSLTGFRSYPDLQDKNYLDVEVAKTKTDENGYYEFNRVRISDLARYYIEFTYDGITYQSVARTKPGDEGATEEYKIKDGNNTYNIQIPNSKTSKAFEDYMLRGKLNDAFGEIVGLGEDGNGQEVTYNGNNVRLDENNYSTKTTEHASTNTRTKEVTLNDIYSRYWKRPTGNSSTVIIDQEAPGKVGRKYDFLLNAKIGTISSSGSNDLLKFYNIMAYGSTTYTNRENNNGNWYCNNKKELLTEIKNLNLGLYRREQPNLTLNKNLYKADISVNGKNYTYKYTMNNEEVKKDEPFSYKVYDDYNLPLYEADVRTLDNGSPVTEDKQFKATITYRIQLSNLSTNLYTKVNSLNDYFTHFNDGTGLDIDIDNDGKYAIYLSNNPMETNFDKRNRVEVNNVNSSSGIQDEDDSGIQISYWKRNIRFENGIELPPIQGEGSNTKYLYIRFNMEKANTYCEDAWRNGSVPSSNLENYVEIASYSVFKDKNYSEKYAHIDSTSIPQNLLDKGRLSKDIYQRRHEDDDSRATGLKIIKSTARNITGMVFEDAPVKSYTLPNSTTPILIDQISNGKIDATEERIGDGIYNTSKVANDNNMNGLKDKGLKGVKIRLREIGEEGKYKNTKMWVPNGTGGGEWKEAIIESNDNGLFELSNFIPGNYKVEFVWGEEAGGKDATRFKGTIFTNTNSLDTSKKEGIYDSKVRYSDDYWYENNIAGTSSATDDYIRRLAIDKEALSVKDNAYEGLKYGKPGKQVSLLEKVNEKIQNAKDEVDKGDVYASLDYMHSSTADFSAEVERYAQYGEEENTKKIGHKGNGYDYTEGFGFNIKDIDFGIIERAKQAMGVQKHIKSIKITTAEGRPVVIATIDINGKINAIAGERYLSGGYDLGYIWAQMDKQLQESMKVEIEYEITVGSMSEKDFDDPNYYLYGNSRKNPIKLRATFLYDYLGGSQITSDSKEENAWVTEYTEEGKKYLRIDPVDSNKTIPTLADKAIKDIYTNSTAKNEDYKTYINNNYYLDNNLDEKGFNTQDARDTLIKVYEHWLNTGYTGNINDLRKTKLNNKEIIQGDPDDNVLVNAPYESGDIRTERLKASKLINVGEELNLTNDVELATVTLDVKQKTGASVNYKNSPLYDIAEYATLSPAQGENRDYFGMTMVAISILTLLGSGIILIKRFIKNR